MDNVSEAMALLPSEMSIHIPAGKVPEEIRIRLGRPVSSVCGGRELPVGTAPVTEAQIRKILEKATGASLHTHAEELKNGFVSYKGIRIGLGGDAVVQNGAVTGFRSFSSLNIRIPSEHRGMCTNVFTALKNNGDASVLFVSPPGGGKTTALRELVRCLSDYGKRVAVVDERGEISGGQHFDLGSSTDVLVNCPKAIGTMMALRSLSPEYIAVDEITGAEDMALVESMAGCGVQILATAHASNRDALTKRLLYQKLMGLSVFDYVVTIENDGGSRRLITERLPCAD